jgi:threonine synthase
MLDRLTCSVCDVAHDARRPWRACRECGGALLARYRITPGRPGPRDLLRRPTGLHRLAELSPLAEPQPPSLGEGATPLIRGQGLAVALDLPGLLIKDEGANPTGSIEDRARATATARARELGVGTVQLDGDEVSAAAYLALHGLDRSPDVDDDGVLPLPDAPWGLEGLKTIAFELTLDLGRPPDVLLIPTGRGATLIGLFKGFDELRQLGWITTMPRLIAVQSDACAPVVRAVRKRWTGVRAARKPGASAASRLLVPDPPLGDLLLQAIERSGGAAIAVEERELLDGVALAKERLGLSISPEGGAAVAASRELRRKRTIRREETIVLLNPARGPRVSSVNL